MTQALRGHHLLCALGFRGYGYSPEFAANMAEVLRRLDAEPRTRVAVVDEPDAICAAFPHDRSPHCGEAAVRTRDRRVMAALGLRAGQAAPWGELRRRVARAFAPPDLDELCATCPWRPLGYCAEGLARLRAEVGVPPRQG